MAEKRSLCEDYVVSDKCGVGEKGIDGLIKASIARKDGKHELFRGQKKIVLHASCRKKYTRPQSITRILKIAVLDGQPLTSSSTPCLRSSQLEFDFKKIILVKIGAQRANEVLHGLQHLFISHFLSRIITGDETWEHNFTPYIKPNLNNVETSYVAKKFQVSPSTGKVVLTVFYDTKGVILIDFLTSRTINAAWYCDTFTKLMSAFDGTDQGS
ncbi:hypothetical protein AVEN_231975-1 [Araneus ventricosus]|uniref:Uncharacterized protein n=1 Tax=Araneus ventricosus TaxID=182803 RepID=A0A4Y2C105_ARAVE|nr:hypothetical protein AVEN_231975-1 [Araneus ventricosus]